MKDQYTPELIHSLADNLNAGLICHLNPDSFEVIVIPKALLDEFDSEYLEDFQSDLDRVDSEWNNCITIEPPEPFESFKFMERFASDEIQDQPMQGKLINALSHGKPFRNFKNIVESSEFSQQWFDFQQRCLEEYVRDRLNIEEWREDAEEEL